MLCSWDVTRENFGPEDPTESEKEALLQNLNDGTGDP